MNNNGIPSSLKLATFNVNGTGKYEKQKDIFDFLRKKKFDLVMLQETHWKTESENYIRTLWGYNCIVCGTSTSKNGVAILFNNSFKYTIHNVIRDNENGCFIIMDITIFEKRYTIVNVYGPSDKDNPNFFESLFGQIGNNNNEQVIIAGDWNVILNPSVDARNYQSYNSRPRSRKFLVDKMEQLDLVDIYRTVYPSNRSYTWRKFNTIKQSRLDYFIISDSLIADVTHVDIIPGYRSDHSIVCLFINTDQTNQTHKPYWKFNNSLLRDKFYIDSIKETIEKTIKQYAVPVYNFDNLKDVEHILFTINDQLFFEILLLEIRGVTISYASYKKKRETIEEDTLVKRIELLESIPDLSQSDITELEETRIRLQEIREHKMKGMILRSRLNWLQHGEKPSNYFCNLENRNFKSKRMAFLEKEDGSIIYNQDDMVNETQTFYKNLYQFRPTEDVRFEDIILESEKLNDNEKASIEGHISFEEAAAALKNMKNNKSPGNSGYTTEFFKFFFKDIGKYLVRAINYGFDVGSLSITQRQGVITCIPKDGKNPQHLKNWRPISLLNVSYKIASSCICNRLKLFLPKIINSSQKSFLNGRNINDNLKLMYDVLLYTETEDIPGLLLLVDFHKAFDSVSWEFIDKTLAFFNFGVEIRKWIKVFYNNISSCVQVNGQYSEYFPIQRGVRQGDSLSAYLFLLCGEILSRMLHENEIVKGISINDKEAFLSQFADDTALFLDGSRESFEQCIHILNKFANISGLSMNFDKTVVVWLGSKKNCGDRYLRDMNFTWDPGGILNSKFKYLGIIFSTNTKNIVDLNYNSKLMEIEKLLKTWNKRFLTPFGKITIIKTLALSKLTYLFSNIPDPDMNFLKNVNSLFVKFLWNDKPSKISFDTICQSFDNGGLNMVNIFEYLAMIKINCFKRYLYNEDVFNMTNAMYPIMKDILVMGNDYFNVIMQTVKNPLLHDVLKHVKSFFAKVESLDIEDVIYDRLFHNVNIRIGNKTVCLRSWVNQSVTQICHVLKDSGEFLSHQEFVIKYPNIRTHFLQYNGLVNSIRSFFRRNNIVIGNNLNIVQGQEPTCWRSLRKDKKEIKEQYKKKPKTPHISKQKWNQKYDNLNWKQIFSICQKTTKDTKIRWFQFRLIYRMLPTNRFLTLRKIKNSALCELCNDYEETISHLFWECEYVKFFWNELKLIFIDKIPHIHNLTLSEQLVLFGYKENIVTDTPFNLLLLAAKYYIYTCKLSNVAPSARLFVKQFKLRYKLEKLYYNDISNERFTTEWRPYENLVT